MVEEALSRADEVMKSPVIWFDRHSTREAVELIGLLAGYLRAYMRVKTDLEQIAIDIASKECVDGRAIRK